MKNEDEKNGLDFEFDESLEGDINDEDGDSNSDDALIDLLDIVEEEKVVDDPEPGEIKELLDEEESVQEESGPENELSSAFLDGIDQVLGDDATEILELDDELNIKNSGPLEEIILPGPENIELSEEGFEEINPEDTLELSKDDLTEELSTEKLLGISEERLEAIITKAVQDSVERVSRETMANVAEKVIGESIEALKQSLDVRVESTPK
ncbi:MAG: hypothetical protein GY864_05085 [Desulfobacterales bacterium]|nr:hypothetical protein [Desulfobacterales bacterium]